jgi:hypothetical protein
VSFITAAGGGGADASEINKGTSFEGLGLSRRIQIYNLRMLMTCLFVFAFY